MASTKEFTLSKPTAKASKGRTYALYCAVGVDVRKAGLTNQQAHDFLNSANSGKAYHVRKSLLELEGSVKAKKDVAKVHRGDPKPNGKAKAKSKGKGNGDPDTAELLAMIRERPEVLKALLSGVAGLASASESEDDEEEEDEEEEEEEEKVPETKAKARAKKETPKAAPKKKTGTRVTTKNGANVTVNSDDTISDADLLTMLANAAKNAA